MAPVLLTEVDLARLEVSALKRLPNSTIANVLYGSVPLDAQLPELEAPFEVDDKYNTLRLNLSTDADDAVAAKFRGIEELVKRIAVERSWDWFGQRFHPDDASTKVEAMFKSSLFLDSTGKYLSVKLKCGKDTTYWTPDKRLATKAIVAGRSLVRTIVRPSYVYFMAEKGVVKQFGITYLLRQAVVVGVAEKESDTGVFMFLE
jgi:hypothetical protein